MYPFGVHIPDIPVILQKLDELAAQIADLKAQGVRHMAEVTAQVQEVLTAIDTETNALADRIDAKFATFADSMDPAEAAPLLAFGQEIANRLRGIAADPANPVPTPEPPAA